MGERSIDKAIAISRGTISPEENFITTKIIEVVAKNKKS
jgi:hypothetical protein